MNRVTRGGSGGLAAIFAAACGVPQRQPLPAEPPAPAAPAPLTAAVAPTPATSSAPGAAPVAPDAGRAPASCVPLALRGADLDAAWPESDRVMLCVTGGRRPDAGLAPATEELRSCVSVGPSGDARMEPSRPSPRRRPLETVGFRAKSADGLLSFRFSGGARSPHGAKGTLLDARSKRVLMQAPVAYDEHVVFEGWMGQGIVLETWVDEGPGCGLWLFDPRRSWPDLVNGGGAALGSCNNGDLVLSPLPGTFVLVDARGEVITFVDEPTLTVTQVQTGAGAGDADRKGRLVTWLDGSATDPVLVLVYGSPSTGAVVRVDLKKRVVLGRWVPPVCAGG